MNESEPIRADKVEDKGADARLRFCRSVRDRLTVNPDLLIDFLATFARAEYSLKVTKFRQGGNGEAKADWSAFSRAAIGMFNVRHSELIKSAFTYLTENPPRCLSVQDGAVSWMPQMLPSTSDADKILWIIRQVRHNLFHGGKFAYDANADHERDNKLLEASTMLMSYLISLVPEVEQAFLS